MSKNSNLIVVEKQHPNPRIHLVLFKANSPFKPKKQQNRVSYQRHNKHRNQIDQ